MKDKFCNQSFGNYWFSFYRVSCDSECVIGIDVFWESHEDLVKCEDFIKTQLVVWLCDSVDPLLDFLSFVCVMIFDLVINLFESFLDGGNGQKCWKEILALEAIMFTEICLSFSDGLSGITNLVGLLILKGAFCSESWDRQFRELHEWWSHFFTSFMFSRVHLLARNKLAVWCLTVDYWSTIPLR